MRGSIKKRGNGSYTLIYDAPRGEDGKRKQVWVTFQGTKPEAENELARLIHEAATGAFVDPSKVTLGEYLKEWLKQIEHDLARQTWEDYSRTVTKHIIPDLGNKKLGTLKPSAIQSYYTKKRVYLSGTSLQKHHAILHKALGDAVKLQILARNPVDAVQRPKGDNKKQNVLEPEEVTKLLDTADGTIYYMPILLAACCGLRQGEALALRWEDVDLEAGTVLIQHSLEHTSKGLRLKGTKSGKPRRNKLSELAWSELQRHKEMQAIAKAMSPDYVDSGFVCTFEHGEMISPRYLGATWKRVRDRADIRRVRFHDLRHTYATMLIESGEHLRVVMELLGHSSMSMTYDLYSHVTEAMQTKAADHIDKLIKRPKRGSEK
jgi:integrase